MRNLKLAMRLLLKAPSVTLIAVLSLGLGIGSTTAIFSMFQGLVRKPLPVQEPDRLVNLSSPGARYGEGSTHTGSSGGGDDVFSYPMFRDLEKTGVFAGVAAHRSFDANLAFKGTTPLRTIGLLVSGSYFPVLGLRPAIGRLLGPEDDAAIEQPFVAVLEYSYWRTTFGGSPAVLGETLMVNGRALTIVGVAPEGFNGTTMGQDDTVFVPIRLREIIEQLNEGSLQDRKNYWVYLFARLKPGFSMEQASGAASAPYHNIINNVEVPLQRNVTAQELTEFRAKKLLLAPGYRGQSYFFDGLNQGLILLMIVTGLVLLIACANLANLLLARAAGRADEMAVRLAIGASRRNLVSQLLVESLILAFLGGAAGLVIARWTSDGIMWLADMGGIYTYALNPTVLLFVAAVTLSTGIVFGLYPALQSTRSSVATPKGVSAQTSRTRGAARYRWTLATAQIAMSTTLLISAGLFAKSLFNTSQVKLGFNPDHLVFFAVSPSLSGYSSERSRALFQEIETELAAQPGVTDVTAAYVPLLTNDGKGTDVAVQGFPAGPGVDSTSSFNLIGPGYFRKMGIPLLAGREFTDSDTWGATGVFIVNEQFAKKFRLGDNPVGKRMAWDSSTKDPNVEIVGLVRDARHYTLTDEPPPLFFSPYRQTQTIKRLTFYVRGAVPEDALLAMIPRVVAKVAPNLPVDYTGTMQKQIESNMGDSRTLAVLCGSFAVLATLLAATGLYGVISYSVAQRTREFGVRLALGATRSKVRSMVLRQVGLMTLIGAVVGIVSAWNLARWGSSMLFKVESYEPLVFWPSTILLALVAIAAGFLPARRASKVDPMTALRYE
jgi:predicted permease